MELSAASDRSGAPADADFRIDRLPANTHLCIDSVGRQHFIFKTNQKRVGLKLDGAQAVLAPVRLLFSTVSMSGVSKAAGEFALLNELLLSGSSKAVSSSKVRSVTRLEFRDALIALDGNCAGATRREIACVIYGHERVAAEWSDPAGVMKDRVKRSLKRGQRLVDGGYRALLR